MKNYYAVLGLPLTASAEDIKVAYRQNCKKYHPDLNPGYENLRQRFLEINEAYDILSVPEKKKEYDAKIEAYRRARAQKAKQSAQQAHQNAQQHSYHSSRPQQKEAPRPTASSGAHYSYRQPPHQETAKQQPPPRSAHSESPDLDDSVLSAVKTYSDKKLREIKKTYDMRVAVLRKNNKTEIRDLRKRLLAQIDAHKKLSDVRMKKMSEKYKKNLKRAFTEVKHYKENYRQRSFNAGMEVGIKEAYADSKKTTDELKGIIESVNRDLDKLRTEKQILEEKYIKAKENDDGIGAADLIKIHREKMEIETEFAKTKNMLHEIEVKLTQAESENRQLHSETELLRKSSEDSTRLIAKEKKELENKLSKATTEVQALEEDVRSKNILLKEKDREIYDLKDELSELRRSLKIFGISEEKTKEGEDAETAKFESEQRERAKGTLYEVLGLPLTALHDEIEWAFDSLTKQLKGKKEFVDHYIKIIEAYNILSDEDSKAEYDESINNTTEL